MAKKSRSNKKHFSSLLKAFIEANKIMLFDGESRTLKNFNNYITIMTNSSDTIRIL